MKLTTPIILAILLFSCTKNYQPHSPLINAPVRTFCDLLSKKPPKNNHNPNQTTCTLENEYRPLVTMGNPNNIDFSPWTTGTTSKGCLTFQNDSVVIANRLQEGFNVFYLDFTNSGLDSSGIAYVTDRIEQHFKPFNCIFTINLELYNSIDIYHRQQIIFTTEPASSGGSAVVNSFGYFIGIEIPAYVYTAANNFNLHNIGEAAAHEIGHTTGCYHQSDWLIN